jgi:hypothetical protein
MALLTPQATPRGATWHAMVHEPGGEGRAAPSRAPSQELRSAAMRKKRQGQNERSYHPESRIAQASSTGDVDMELAAAEHSQLAAAEPRSFVHTDFTLPRTAPDHLPNYLDEGMPPPPGPRAPVQAPPGSAEGDVWASAHSEQDVWAEAHTEQGERYYYHIVTGETAWERHCVL